MTGATLSDPHVADLFHAARAVLRGNDRGDHVVAAPHLYPHQWSWDSALIAVGLARISVPRAITELRSLLRAQWSTGMIPQIVFADEPGYFPGPDRWRTGAAAPAGTATSGICQPPVHGIAVYRIVAQGRANGGADARAAEEFLTGSFDSWLAWHRYLARVRDPGRIGLVEIHHSWESGMDNSPRWDGPYSRVRPGEMAPFERLDNRHVVDARQRPSDEDYRRYLWLVEQMAATGWDEEAIARSVDFRVGDVFCSALLAHSSDLLAELADGLSRSDDASELRAIAARFRAGVLRAVSARTGLARDFDVRTSRWIDSATIAGFAPLLCVPPGRVRDALRARLLGPLWSGHPALRFAVPPTTAPGDPRFRPRTYWRGPQWPIISWLLWWTAQRYGDTLLADRLRSESLRQLADGSFAEYYESLTGEGLGSAHQSWTAAVAVDWLAS